MGGKHFVLVHGACHGAWCWYKVKPRLESAGHRVTLVDLAGSGIDRRRIQDVRTFEEYSEPLLQIISSLGPYENVILVGHSLGGMNLALAMEKHPNKITAAVFVAGFVPDTIQPPARVYLQCFGEDITKVLLDTEFSNYGSEQEPLLSIFFGPKFTSDNLYQLSPTQDLELAKTLLRPSSLFIHDLSGSVKFSDEGYGSVKRVYVICEKDKAITKEMQLGMIKSSGTKSVMEIKDADHMAMLSKPKELCDCLLEIASKMCSDATCAYE